MSRTKLWLSASTILFATSIADAGTLTPIKQFEKSPSGTFPGGVLPGPMTIDRSGTIYGVAGGGAYDYGSIYRLQTGGQYKIIYSFAPGPEGVAPQAKLLLSAKIL